MNNLTPEETNNENTTKIDMCRMICRYLDMHDALKQELDAKRDDYSPDVWKMMEDEYEETRSQWENKLRALLREE